MLRAIIRQIISYQLLVLLLTLLVTIIQTPQPALAEGTPSAQLNLTQESVNPGSPQYVFKRLMEKIQTFLAFSTTSKFKLHQSFLGKRLAELKYITDQNQLDLIESTSQRFAFEAGSLIPLSQSANPDQKKALTAQLNQFQSLIDQIRDKYPSNSAYWLLLQHDHNTLTALFDKLH